MSKNQIRVSYVEVIYTEYPRKIAGKGGSNNATRNALVVLSAQISTKMRTPKLDMYATLPRPRGVRAGFLHSALALRTET